MSGAVTLTLDLQVAKALQGLTSVISKQDQYDQSLIKTIGITRDQAKANADLVNTQKQSHELVMAFKKHEMELEQRLAKGTIEEKNKILKRHQEVEALISGSQLARQRMIIDSEKLISATKESEANKEIARVQRSLQLQKGFLRGYAQEGEGLNKVLMTTSDYLKSIGREQAGQASSGFASQLQTVAASYAGIAFTLRAIHGAMAEVRSEAEKAASLVKAREETMGGLFQVAEGATPQAIGLDVDKMVVESGTEAQKAGWDFNETLKARLEARNSDADAQFSDIMKYAPLTRDPALVAKAVGQFKHNFGDENLDFKTIANESLVAAQGSPVDMKDIFIKLGGSSSLAKQVGSSSEEFMSYYSALAKGYGNASEAAEALGYLISKGNAKGMGGKGIGDIASQMMRLDPMELASEVGEREGLQKTLAILRTPASQELLKNQQAAVADAKRRANDADSPLNLRLNAINESREMTAVAQQKRAKAGNDYMLKEVGIGELGRESRQLDASSQMLGGGISAPMRGAANWLGRQVDYFLPPEMAGNVQRAVQQTHPSTNGAGVESMLGKISGTLDNILSVTKQNKTVDPVSPAANRDAARAQSARATWGHW